MRWQKLEAELIIALSKSPFTNFNMRMNLKEFNYVLGSKLYVAFINFSNKYKVVFLTNKKVGRKISNKNRKRK